MPHKNPPLKVKKRNELTLCEIYKNSESNEATLSQHFDIKSLAGSYYACS